METPFSLHKLHIEDIQNSEHPSIFIEDEEYNILILRVPNYSENLELISHPFILSNNRAYYYNRNKDDFVDLGEGFRGVYKFIDKKIDQVIKLVNNFHEEIIVSEEGLYNHNTSNFLKEWYGQKMELIKIQRVMLRANTTIDEFVETYQENEEFLHNEFEDIIEHIARSERSAQSGLLKLDQLYSFYTVRTSEKMNKSIYLLTIISAIFLPLNLAVGFFGMNTGGLPLGQNPHGTIIAVSAMLGATLLLTTITTLYLKRQNREFIQLTQNT